MFVQFYLKCLSYSYKDLAKVTGRKFYWKQKKAPFNTYNQRKNINNSSTTSYPSSCTH